MLFANEPLPCSPKFLCIPLPPMNAFPKRLKGGMQVNEHIFLFLALSSRIYLWLSFDFAPFIALIYAVCPLNNTIKVLKIDHFMLSPCLLYHHTSPNPPASQESLLSSLSSLINNQDHLINLLITIYDLQLASQLASPSPSLVIYIYVHICIARFSLIRTFRRYNRADIMYFLSNLLAFFHVYNDVHIVIMSDCLHRRRIVYIASSHML